MNAVGPHAPPGAAPVLQAELLSVLRGTRRVVNGVTLALHAGQVLALVGPNGAGKSTLLAALAGLLPAEEGEVRLDARPIAHGSPRERARRMAWLAQSGELEGDLRVRDVVRLGRLPQRGLFGAWRAEDDAAVAAAMAATECTALAERPVAALSGGERQRVWLARALAVGACVLLLDEPTTHLDPPHQRALWQRLRAEAARGAAVAAVLHDPTLALAADRVAVLQAGRLVALGAPSDVELQQTLVRVFDGAFDIERSAAGRWLAVLRS